MARARAAKVSEFPALFHELPTVFPNDKDLAAWDAAQTWLLSLWIAADPDAAIAFVEQQRDERFEWLSSSLGRVLATIAPRKALALLRTSSRESLGLWAGTAMVVLAENYPREFLSLRDETKSPNAIVSALIHLAKTDPPAAASFWAAEVLRPVTQPSLYAIVDHWTVSDPGAARLWVDSLTDPLTRSLARHAWLASLAKKDPTAAQHELATLDLGDWLTPNEAVDSFILFPQDARLVLLSELAKKSIPDALAALEKMLPDTQLPDPYKEVTLSSDPFPDIRGKAILDTLAAAAASSLPKDPPSLFATMRRIVSGPERSALANKILEIKAAGWSAATSLEAARWLSVFPGQGSLHSTPILIGRIMEDDPSLLPAFLPLLPEKEQGETALNIITKAGPSLSPALVGQLTTRIPAASWDHTLAVTVAGIAPAETAAAIAALPLNRDHEVLRIAFTATWAEDDPAAAACWVSSLSANQGAAHAAEGLANTWAGYDEASASTWVAALPAGPQRDGAAAGLAVGIASTDPWAAWEWAASITDPAFSLEAHDHIARAWGNEAPADFRVSLTNVLDFAQTPPAERDAILALLQQPPKTNE